MFTDWVDEICEFIVEWMLRLFILSIPAIVITLIVLAISQAN